MEAELRLESSRSMANFFWLIFLSQPYSTEPQSLIYLFDKIKTIYMNKYIIQFISVIYYIYTNLS